MALYHLLIISLLIPAVLCSTTLSLEVMDREVLETSPAECIPRRIRIQNTQTRDGPATCEDSRGGTIEYSCNDGCETTPSQQAIVCSRRFGFASRTVVGCLRKLARKRCPRWRNLTKCCRKQMHLCVRRGGFLPLA